MWIAGVATLLGVNKREQQVPPSAEDLGWLTEARKGKRLWQRLLAAVDFGRSMEDYLTFEDSTVEDTILRLASENPGKQTSPKGLAVDRIIEEFRTHSSEAPTPAKILLFLGGRGPRWLTTSLLRSITSCG